MTQSAGAPAVHHQPREEDAVDVLEPSTLAGPDGLRGLTLDDVLSWFPDHARTFHVPASYDEMPALLQWLTTLDDGTCISVRGRDSVDHAWAYGIGLKTGQRIFYIYEDGSLECLTICYTNFLRNVNIAFPPDRPAAALGAGSPLCDARRVIILSHGWSPVAGPNYATIKVLQHAAQKMGWRVIIPDFRAVYKYGTQRSRAERTRLIYEEMLCIDPRPERLVLAGHSQGGAASAYACTDRVVRAMNVTGLFMAGSESPALDAMNWVPRVPHIAIVHAAGDRNIYPATIEEVAARWNVPVTILTSTVRDGSRDHQGDDICHDFLQKDLMDALVKHWTSFLDGL